MVSRLLFTQQGHVSFISSESGAKFHQKESVMFKLLSTILLFSFSASICALDYDFTAGLGTQYGGLGGQFVVNDKESKYFLALGTTGEAGVAVGMKSIISDDEHHSMGVNIGSFGRLLASDTDFAAITYNYHFDGFNGNGWEIGTGIAYYKQDEYKVLFVPNIEKEKSGVSIVFNLGYTF